MSIRSRNLAGTSSNIPRATSSIRRSTLASGPHIWSRIACARPFRSAPPADPQRMVRSLGMGAGPPLQFVLELGHGVPGERPDVRPADLPVRLPGPLREPAARILLDDPGRLPAVGVQGPGEV